MPLGMEIGLVPGPHCVRWEPSFPLQRGTAASPMVHVYYGQTAGWIKMPLGLELRR